MSATELPIIYLDAALDIMDELTGYALAADGTLLASHQFPDEQTARARMDRPTRLYKTHYPTSYRLIWQPKETDPGYQEARRLNREKWEAQRPQREAERQ